MRKINIENNNELVFETRKKLEDKITFRPDCSSIETINKLLELSNNKGRKINTSDIIRACILNSNGISKDINYLSC